MIKLFSTKCGNCITLEKRMKDKGIEFEEINDIEVINKVAKENNLTSVPILYIDGEYLGFSKAIQKISRM